MPSWGNVEDPDDAMVAMNRLAVGRALAWQASAEAGNKGLDLDLAAASRAVLRDLRSTVYVSRHRWFVYTMAAAAASAVLAGWAGLMPGIGRDMSPAAALTTVLAMYLALDAYTGILHTVLDCPGHIDTPLIGRACAEFMWHHVFPHDIATKPLVEACGDTNTIIATIVASAVALVHVWGYRSPAAWGWSAYTAGLAVLFGYLGQWAHRRAHSGATTASCSWLLLSPRTHARHHRHPENGTSYAILSGATEPLLALLRLCVPPRAFPFTWVALWAAATVGLVAVPTWCFVSLFGNFSISL